MKNNALVSVVVAAMISFGIAEDAQPMETLGGATASKLQINPDGIGHILVVPYYSAQGGSATLLNITNADPVNGKAVKIRFRGASNADDLFDFQVFLAPGDVWAADISQKGDGRAGLTSGDPSCKKPNLDSSFYSNYGFSTERLDPAATAAVQAAGTREGYIEMINMADIRPGTALFTAIMPVSGMAPCSGAAWTALDGRNFSSSVDAYAAGLTPPSTGLMANWIIINVAGSDTYGGAAMAIQANTDRLSATGYPVPGLGNILYWPQTSGYLPNVGTYTADPLLRSGAVPAAQYDLPDLSTPYTNVTPVQQAANLSAAMATTSLRNEFLTNPAINATTDWMFSMPTRRYSAALNYASGAVEYTTLPVNYFTSANTAATARKVCVYGISVKSYGSQANTALNSTPMPAFCGNTSVLSINHGGAAYPSGSLRSTVALQDLDVLSSNGWMSLQTPSPTLGVGLPVMGSAFIRAVSGSSQFGAQWEHRYTR